MRNSKFIIFLIIFLVIAICCDSQAQRKKSIPKESTIKRNSGFYFNFGQSWNKCYHPSLIGQRLQSQSLSYGFDYYFGKKRKQRISGLGSIYNNFKFNEFENLASGWMAQMSYYSDIHTVYDNKNKQLTLGSSILLSTNSREKPRDKSFYQGVFAQTHFLNLDLSFDWKPNLIKNDELLINFGFPVLGHLYSTNYSGVATTEQIFGIWNTASKFAHSRITYKLPLKKLKLGLQYVWQYQNIQNYNVYSIHNLGGIIGI
ncbi:MAG TPA: hypothetical protein PKD85_08800 [Saprospiraceae bacterium]|nr:hypothetical protein [Saprospiraceae bacterium]